MARKSSVRYWESRGGYCCWHNGSQILLAKGPDDAPDGPTYAEAVKKWSRLQSGAHGVTVAECIEKYLVWVGKHREPSTAAIRLHMLAPVKAVFGDRVAVSLTPIEVQEWCDAEQTRKGWSEGTTRLTLVSFRACLNWAAKGRLIAAHPLPEMELPEEESRGQECVLTPEQVAAVLAACRWPAERDFLQALRDTGARPSEISGAEAKHYDPVLRALVFEAKVRKGQKRHKNHRTGKARTVYLRGPTVEVVERLVKEHPSGPLFRSSRRKWAGEFKGKSWGWKESTILHVFRRIRKQTGLQNLIPYSFRHTFAVRALRRGVRIEWLAEIMGTSIKMIQDHYGHLADQTDYLRRVVDDLDASADAG